MPTKILAIDDSKTMRLAIKITFAAEDADVVAVSRGSEAIARAKQMHADVVLVDHALATGEPSGFDVCKALKADPSTAEMPVILMIPAHGGVGQAEVQASGADASIRKPFESQELIDAVGRAVGQAASRAVSTGVPAARPVTAPVEPDVATRSAAVVVAEREDPLPTPVPASTTSDVPAQSPQSAPAGAAGRRSTPEPASPAPVAASVSAEANRSAPLTAAAVAAPAPIPIVVPIPFAPADAPTPGMIKRLEAAQRSSAGLSGIDPKAIDALLSLTREVVEQVVWEVVPELAEEIIKQRAQG
ncbi:MAG: response regulator [Nannocystaceae bacterium]